MYEALIIIFRKQLQTKKDPDLTGDGSTTLPRMVTNRQQDIKKITKFVCFCSRSDVVVGKPIYPPNRCNFHGSGSLSAYQRYKNMHDWDPDPQHTTPPPVVDLLGRMRVLAADEGGDAGLLGVSGRRVGHISSQEDHRLVEHLNTQQKI